jgi:hypothetical protein
LKNTNLFSEIIGSSEIIPNYFDSNIKYNGDTEWIDIFGFDAVKIEKNIWIKERILDLVNKKFPIFACGILRINSNSTYDWHVDDERGVCINMLLSFDHFSKCCFYENNEVIILNYKKSKFYLFNNQKLHMVENFEKPRYLFSIQFVDKKEKLDYNTVYSWMTINNLIENK